MTTTPTLGPTLGPGRSTYEPPAIVRSRSTSPPSSAGRSTFPAADAAEPRKLTRREREFHELRWRLRAVRECGAKLRALRDRIVAPVIRGQRLRARERRLAARAGCCPSLRSSARPRERRAARTASSSTSSSTSGAGDGADGPPPSPQRPPSSGGGVSLDRLPIPPRFGRGGRRDSGLSRDALLTGSPGVALSSTPDRAPVALNAADERPGRGAPVIRTEGTAAMFDLSHRAEGREGAAEVRLAEQLERSADRREVSR